jgi:hypothetical protein
MRLNFSKTQGIVLLALLGSVVSTSNPSLAAPKNLQWRSTRCQLDNGKEVIYEMDCKVAFASGGKIYAGKFFDERSNQTVYYEIGINGPGQGVAKDDIRECMLVNNPRGPRLNFCTVNTPWELGIKGAPYDVSPSEDTQPAPSSYVRPAGPDPNSFFNIRVRCDRAYPGHNYVNHPDQEGWKRCVRMGGQY